MRHVAVGQRALDGRGLADARERLRGALRAGGDAGGEAVAHGAGEGGGGAEGGEEERLELHFCWKRRRLERGC